MNLPSYFPHLLFLEDSLLRSYLGSAMTYITNLRIQVSVSIHPQRRATPRPVRALPSPARHVIDVDPCAMWSVLRVCLGPHPYWTLADSCAHHWTHPRPDCTVGGCCAQHRSRHIIGSVIPQMHMHSSFLPALLHSWNVTLGVLEFYCCAITNVSVNIHV